MYNRNTTERIEALKMRVDAHIEQVERRRQDRESRKLRESVERVLASVRRPVGPLPRVPSPAS